MEPEIAIVVSPRDWAERLHRFVADHGGARVRARVLDGREALDEGYQVLVAEDLTSFLTPRLMAELRRSGRRVLGVYDPVEPWGRDRLGELGVDDTIESTATPEQLLRAVDALALTADVDLDAELVDLNEAPERGTTASFEPPSSREVEADVAPRRIGQVTVVGGPSGAPGATEIAIGLAHAAARRGESAVLVDADEVAPSVAQRLGLDLHPNLRTAIDVVEHWTGQLSDALTPVPAGRFEVLCGLASTRDWSELRPGEVVDVVDELARARHHVIVNVGHRVEELGGMGGPSRYGVTRTILAEADVLVGVLAPTPVGIARYLEWVADVRALTRTPIHAVANRAPGSAFKRGEVEEELRRTYEPATLTHVPADRHVAEAEWAGALVTSTPFVRALDTLSSLTLARPSVAADRQGVAS